LAAVEMAREEEVEDVGGKPADVVREMDEQDPKISPRIGESLDRVIATARVGADDLDRSPSDLQLRRSVLEEAGAVPADVGELGRTAEGVSRGGDVVIAENGEDAVMGVEPGETLPQNRLPATAADEIAGHGDEVEFTLFGPRERLVERAAVEGDGAEVEVGEVEDAKAVELGRQPADRDVPLEQLDPLGFEERPSEARRAQSHGAEHDGERH
jgi:hypothetical protein